MLLDSIMMDCGIEKRQPGCGQGHDWHGIPQISARSKLPHWKHQQPTSSVSPASANWPCAAGSQPQEMGEEMAIKRHPWRYSRESATPWGVERSFFETYALTVLRRQVAKPLKMPDTHNIPKTNFLVAAGRTVAESSVAALGNLLLSDLDNVDGDRVELRDSVSHCTLFTVRFG